MFGLKEARFTDHEDIRNREELEGPYAQLFLQDKVTLGEPQSHISVAYDWAINEAEQKEIIRVSLVNDMGLLVFDSIVTPSKRIKYVSILNFYLYDPSFGIPLKYLK